MPTSLKEIPLRPVNPVHPGGTVFDIEKIIIDGKNSNMITPGKPAKLTLECRNKTNSAKENLQASLTVSAAHSSLVKIGPKILQLPSVEPGGIMICGPFTVELSSDIYLTLQKDKQDSIECKDEQILTKSKDKQNSTESIEFILNISQALSTPDTVPVDSIQIKKLSKDLSTPNTVPVDTLLFKLHFSLLQIVSSSFVASDYYKCLVAFIEIKNHAGDLEGPQAQFIFNGCGSTVQDLEIDDIPNSEQKKQLYGIEIAANELTNNNVFSGDLLTGCLNIESNLQSISIPIEMPIPLISVCVMNSDTTSLKFVQGAEIQLWDASTNEILTSKSTDNNGRVSFYQNDVGTATVVEVQRTGSLVSRTLNISSPTKHHCTLEGSHTTSVTTILRQFLVNTEINTCPDSVVV